MGEAPKLCPWFLQPQKSPPAQGLGARETWDKAQPLLSRDWGSHVFKAGVSEGGEQGVQGSLRISHSCGGRWFLCRACGLTVHRGPRERLM